MLASLATLLGDAVTELGQGVNERQYSCMVLTARSFLSLGSQDQGSAQMVSKASRGVEERCAVGSDYVWRTSNLISSGGTFILGLTTTIFALLTLRKGPGF